MAIYSLEGREVTVNPTVAYLSQICIF